LHVSLSKSTQHPEKTHTDQHICQSTFLFHRLNVDQVPSGWSNDPKDLEKALSIPVQDCGDSFKEPMPVLVFIHHHEVITWYIFEASGKYYLYSRLTSSLHQIDEPGNLDEVLAKLAESGTERVRTVHVGRVYGDDLECGSLMAAS
jgi:hypothetical protein